MLSNVVFKSGVKNVVACLQAVENIWPMFLEANKCFWMLVNAITANADRWGEKEVGGVRESANSSAPEKLLADLKSLWNFVY